MIATAEQFRFLDPGPLIDRELELVEPAHRWISPMLEAIAHPLTRQLAPKEAAMTREVIERFVDQNPLGRQHPDPDKGIVAQYHFWMRCRRLPGYAPPGPMAGGLGLRISDSENTRMYYGHIGYNVFPPARGRHFAERACRLILPLARRHGLRTLWITCNPDNTASRRTCERLGASLIEVVELPEEHPLYQRGERQKCRYRLDV
jgi:predicted acetyltransferase